MTKLYAEGYEVLRYGQRSWARTERGEAATNTETSPPVQPKSPLRLPHSLRATKRVYSILSRLAASQSLCRVTSDELYYGTARYL